ncbi:MAG: hypothetical protein OEV66_06680 [Spirochaetia bacterium]|nr:hypothetical protein [Spirochaetia bacterium]
MFDFQKYYIRITLFYIFIMILSGILLDFARVYPFFNANVPNLYPVLKLIHYNIFLYGLLLNILPGIFVFFAEPETKIFFWGKNITAYCFWLYPISITLGILGNIFGYWQPTEYLEFEWLADIFIACLLALYFKSTLRFFRQNVLRQYVWIFYILIPLMVFSIFFVLLNFRRPTGLLSSSDLISPYAHNILSIAFHSFIVYYFIAIVGFGIAYLILIPILEIDNDLLFSIKIQWKMQTIFFIILLYYQLKFHIYQIETTGLNIGIFLIFASLFIGIRNLNFLKSILKNQNTRLISLIVMFLQIYILGSMLSGLPTFRGLLSGTSWENGQRHLLVTGFFLPAFILFLQKMNSDLLHLNQILEFWWAGVLVLVASAWVFGVIEAGFIGKMDEYGFLEYPAFSEISKILNPYYIIRSIVFCIMFIIAAISVHNIRKKRIL